MITYLLDGPTKGKGEDAYEEPARHPWQATPAPPSCGPRRQSPTSTYRPGDPRSAALGPSTCHAGIETGSRCTCAFTTGVDVFNAARLKGHAHLKTTERHIHLSKRHLEYAQEKIERFRARPETRVQGANPLNGGIRQQHLNLGNRARTYGVGCGSELWFNSALARPSD